ncbi:putative MATE family efflux protein [Alkalibaculum bacchi]|uniref:Probable multidrug resistance protein NorM n=1 Tax=Alkalibaculum bacchi TaxID=645887 RepID=A0A366I5W3_9FIRM|nr:MATE family efflux transporter [Alkalibaculum bacchi]RBP63796.1 putative MATE family efflux protein [Alkalibaculum bacchi]
MKYIDLTEGKVTNVLTKLALPIMGSSLLQFTYNLYDMLLVGGLGSDAVASIGSASFYIGLGYSINALVVIGTGIKVSHALGEKDAIKVRQYINTGLAINLVLALLYGIILVLAGNLLVGFLNISNPIVEDYAYKYLALHAIILFFNFFNTLFIRLLSSYGNNQLSLKISVIGVIVNGIFDPLFIYGLKLGVVGAALGTLVANGVMFVLFLVYSNGIFKFEPKYGVVSNKAKKILVLGLPNASQRVLFTLINILLARIIASFGSDAIAAQKIGLQIESVTYMVTGGLSGAMAAFTGQNYGAKKYDRILEGYRSASKLSIFYASFMTLLFLFFNRPIIRLFIREVNTISITSSYLMILAFSQVFSAIEYTSNGYFTGLGKPKISSSISILFTSLRIPMAYFLVGYFGLSGVWMSISLSSIFKGITAYTVYRITRKKLKPET